MTTRHPNALFWSQWAAHDLPWSKRLQGAWHMRRCTTCRATADALHGEQRAYLQSFDHAAGLADLLRRAPPAPPRRAMWPSLALAGALASLLVAVLQPAEVSLGLRPKGGAAQFALYVQRGADVTPLGATCRPGDALRARYQSTKAYLMVVEVDDAGMAQVVFPQDGKASAPIGRQRQLTPGSWVLDGQGQHERFVALFSDAPLTLTQARPCVHNASACARGTVRMEVTCNKN